MTSRLRFYPSLGLYLPAPPPDHDEDLDDELDDELEVGLGLDPYRAADAWRVERPRPRKDPER